MMLQSHPMQVAAREKKTTHQVKIAGASKLNV
jgi:hypothetical protein